MRSTARTRLLLSLFLLAAGSVALARLVPLWAVNPPELPNALRNGMEPGEARKVLGEPARVSRQIFAHRTLEQWHYGPPHSLRLVFDCPRGQKPGLLLWHKLAPVVP
jgi:hypothetical protein